jgi:hypothetical protein
MTPKQTATLVSRAFCVWFAYWAICDLNAIPRACVALLTLRDLASTSSSIGTHMTARMQISEATYSAFGLILNTVLAIVFYRCGPRVLRFFLGKDGDSAAPDNT